ncbi:hypothetical protein FRB90_012744 [Tulasnella sp. 427]|nr:hypothetical protein FRB90_012744 [Tulasnella sp. 427]
MSRRTASASARKVFSSNSAARDRAKDMIAEAILAANQLPKVSVEGEQSSLRLPLSILHELVEEYETDDVGFLDESVLPKTNESVPMGAARRIQHGKVRSLLKTIEDFFNDQTGNVLPPLPRYVPHRRAGKRKGVPSPPPKVDLSKKVRKRIKLDASLDQLKISEIGEDRWQELASLCEDPWNTSLILAGALFAGEPAVEKLHDTAINGMWDATEFIRTARSDVAPRMEWAAGLVEDMDQIVTSL